MTSVAARPTLPCTLPLCAHVADTRLECSQKQQQQHSSSRGSRGGDEGFLPQLFKQIISSLFSAKFLHPSIRAMRRTQSAALCVINAALSPYAGCSRDQRDAERRAYTHTVRHVRHVHHPLHAIGVHARVPPSHTHLIRTSSSQCKSRDSIRNHLTIFSSTELTSMHCVIV